MDFEPTPSVWAHRNDSKKDANQLGFSSKQRVHRGVAIDNQHKGKRNEHHDPDH